MPKIRLSNRFVHGYKKLPPDIKSKVDKHLVFLSENPLHPSLQSKPIQGAPGIYEERIDKYYRLTYQRLPGDILLLRVVDRHDDVLNNP